MGEEDDPEERNILEEVNTDDLLFSSGKKLKQIFMQHSCTEVVPLIK